MRPRTLRRASPRARRCSRSLPEPLLAEAAADEPETIEDLRDLSIEQLAQIEVRSASKQAEPISRAPTSIFVITGSDIAPLAGDLASGSCFAWRPTSRSSSSTPANMR